MCIASTKATATSTTAAAATMVAVAARTTTIMNTHIDFRASTICIEYLLLIVL